MRYLIIGLGIYGSNLAIDLTNMGHEVIGADVSASIVEGLKDYISTVYIIDATDEASLRLLPLTNVDLVIVAIGENFGASVRAVALLKKAGVKHIYARAVDQLHEAILEGFGIDRILTPEQRAASDLVLEMALGSQVRTLDIGADRLVASFTAPHDYEGLKYAELQLDKTYGVELLAVTRSVETTNIIGMTARHQEELIPEADTTVAAGDHWTCLGDRKAFRSLCRKLSV